MMNEELSNEADAKYFPFGLQERAVICSCSGLRRKSTRVHLVPEPLERVPNVTPDLTEAVLPGNEAAQMQMPPLQATASALPPFGRHERLLTSFWESLIKTQGLPPSESS